MSVVPETTRSLATPGAAAAPLAPAGRAEVPALALGARLANVWVPRAVWTVNRTGRAGIFGIALLLAAAVFLLSTYLKVASEVDALRAELATPQGGARTAVADKREDPVNAVRRLPGRTEMPSVLRQLFSKAAQARLAVDTGKYEFKEVTSNAIVRYQIAFPVSGTYPQIRSFIDSTLATMPAIALRELALDRKSIADADVEAQIGLTVYTAAASLAGSGSASGAPGKSPSLPAEVALARAQAQTPAAPPDSKGRPDRVVAPANAAWLFAPHSWAAPPPPPPPPAPAPPPPEPTAPPLPYSFVGSLAPDGRQPVYFLARGDKMIDAHVGDLLDGIYHFESADGGQLVFVYLPLNTRQTLAVGAPQ